MKLRKFMISFLALSLLLGIGACTQKADHEDHKTPSAAGSSEKEVVYTCPMHPQVKSDEPGECPICGMDLVPVQSEDGHEHGESDHSEHGGQDQSKAPTGVILDPEARQRIGVKTATVARKTVSKTIRTFGVVAFDPALAVAQREYLDASRTSAELKQAARKRLKLLGMSDEEIDALEKRRTAATNLYLPENSATLWVYAALYEDDYRMINAGMNAEIFTPGGDGKAVSGIVRGIDPVFDPKTRTVRARIEVADGRTGLKPNAFVTVVLKSDLGEKLIIPASAYLDSGVRKLAYVVEENRRFIQREITTGEVLEDDVVVLSGLKEGDVVAADALFMVDAEAQLKSGMAVHAH